MKDLSTGPAENQKEEIPEGTSNPVSDKINVPNDIQSMTCGEVRKALIQAQTGKKKGIEISGQVIKNPEKVLKTLNEVLDVIRKYLNVDDNMITFTQLGGENIGLSTKNGILIDSIMLLHPPYRLAHAIVHEIFHSGGSILNEGLVESTTKDFFKVSGLGKLKGGKIELTKKYKASLKSMNKFCNKIKKSGKGIKDVWNLYAQGKYNEIFDLLGKKKEKYKDLFTNAFPELAFGDTDSVEMKVGENVDANNIKPQNVASPINYSGKQKPVMSEMQRKALEKGEFDGIGVA
jgi:hypothetical protein